MRPIPAPRIPDAAPMPEGDSRIWVRHPGPENAERYVVVPCHARRKTLQLFAGQTLLDAVAGAVANEGVDGACAILDGVRLSKMSYVMPDGPADDVHAAWYSETHHATDIRLERATASVGKRDGDWFLHTHATWQDGHAAMGHLLNDQCVLKDDCDVDIWLVKGARLEVYPDPETGFDLFRPQAQRPPSEANAALLTIRPHKDLRRTLEAVCSELGFADARILGLGSLIGAGFSNGIPMTCPISEVLLLDGCRIKNRHCTALPLVCVDPAGDLFQGDLAEGQGAVLVTFEMLVLRGA